MRKGEKLYPSYLRSQRGGKIEIEKRINKESSRQKKKLPLESTAHIQLFHAIFFVEEIYSPKLEWES
jgi:hypothetical protein